MRKLGKKVTLDKRSLQAYKFCVCSNCPCPSGTSSYSAKASDSERKAPTNQGLKQATSKLQMPYVKGSIYSVPIVDSLRYKYEYDVDAVFIGNSSINWDVTESLDTLTYVTLDKNFIDEEVRKCNAYSVYDSDSIKQFSEQLINTLVGYDNYPTL